MTFRPFLITAAVVGLAGCPKPVLNLDAGLPIVVADAGVPDAGPGPDPTPDAGLVYPGTTAAEACPEEAFGVQDDGGEAAPSDGVVFGLCVALRTLHTTALLNGQAAAGPVDLMFTSAQYQAEGIEVPDAFGKFDLKVMRSRYDILAYHPSGIFTTHYGFEEFGLIDLSKDQDRTLAVKSDPIRGSALFAGLPFTSTTYPPDITLKGYGLPPQQQVSTPSLGGAYEVALLEGNYSLYLSSPPEALLGTELKEFPLTYSFNLSGPMQYDINIPGAELEGDIRIDGQPLPDRMPGNDFQLNFTASGASDPTVITHHEGGLSGFHSLVPKGKYAVALEFEVGADKHLPAQVYNKQVAQQLDLNQPATVSKNFYTVPIEGGILVDGVPPVPDPGWAWSLYMYAYASATEPWFLVYYNVPLDSASFSLKAFPGTYFVMVQLDDHLAPDLVSGWYRIDRHLPVFQPINMPINIDTSVLTGKMFIDGQIPPEGSVAGRMVFRDAEGTYQRKIVVAADGEFKARIPKGKYDVFFYIDRNTYPEYASGRHFVASSLDLTSNQQVDLHYDTVLMTGPLRVGGEVVQDVVGGDDVGLQLRRRLDMTSWVWGFAGGTPNYRMRIPEGDYDMWFEIQRDAIDGVAFGTAPMGVRLPAHAPKPPSAK